MKCLVCFALLWPAWGASADSGVVLGLVGDWTVEAMPSQSKKAVHFGDDISRSGKLQGSKGSSIVISYAGQRLYRKCPPDCSVDLAKAQPESEPAFWDRFKTAVKPYISRGDAEDRFIAAVSRAFGADLLEGVLLLRDGRVDLSPALRDMREGSYRLRFEPVGSGAASGAPFSIAWKPGGSAPVTAAGLKPGLRNLVLLDAASGQPTGAEAWVLIGGPADYPRNSASFAELLDATSAWSDELDRTAMRTVLRAWLQALADGKAR